MAIANVKNLDTQRIVDELPLGQVLDILMNDHICRATLRCDDKIAAMGDTEYESLRENLYRALVAIGNMASLFN